MIPLSVNYSPKTQICQFSIVFKSLLLLTYFLQANNPLHFRCRILSLIQHGLSHTMYYHMKVQCKHQTCKTWKKHELHQLQQILDRLLRPLFLKRSHRQKVNRQNRYLLLCCSHSCSSSSQVPVGNKRIMTG